MVTGTKGSLDEIGVWNTDGDMVSSGKTFTTTVPSSTSTSSTVPTSDAVYQALQTLEGNSKEMFILPSWNTTAATANPNSSLVGQFPTALINSTNAVYFKMRVPSDFTQTVTAVIVMIPDTTETIQYDVDTNFGAVGELYNVHSDSITDATASATVNVILQTDISTSLTGLAAGDYLGINFSSDTADLRVLGFISNMGRIIETTQDENNDTIYVFGVDTTVEAVEKYTSIFT